MRTRAVGLLGIAIVLASCGGSGPSPSVTAPSSGVPAGSASPEAPSTSPAPSATSGATPSSMPPAGTSPTPVVAPTLEPVEQAAGHWEAESQLAVARGHPRAVLLGDGRVLVVGNDESYADCVRPDSVESELWDPVRRAWADGPALNAPRAEFALAQVGAGGALVTGGVSAGTSDEDEYQSGHQSISSTYTFDPAATEAWTRHGLMSRARTLPIAATLPDGRVLVAGGYYLSGREGSLRPVPGITLAAYRAGGGDGATGPLDDISPPAVVPALATAEVYDPSTGRWSGTGALRLARIGAPVVTLADGRILVAGTAVSGWGWNYTQPEVDPRAIRTAEVYDPRSSRFRLTKELPEPDWSILGRWGPYPIDVEWGAPGVLVALADGGALLVGQTIRWSERAIELGGTITRTLRYDPATNGWAVVDQVVEAHEYADEPTPVETLVPGHSRQDVAAARLADGRVLIAGGRDLSVTTDDEFPLADAVDIYDPVTDTWFSAQPLPERRSGGAAIPLQDGSLLLVGGQGEGPTCLGQDDDGCERCGERLTGIASVVRFVPGR